MGKIFKNTEEALIEMGLKLKETNLEKLAKSFLGVLFSLEPNENDSNLGSVYFEYDGMWGKYRENMKEIEEKARKVCGESYLPLVMSRRHGFEIYILNNPFHNLK